MNHFVNDLNFNIIQLGEQLLNCLTTTLIFEAISQLKKKTCIGNQNLIGFYTGKKYKRN